MQNESRAPLPPDDSLEVVPDPIETLPAPDAVATEVVTPPRNNNLPIYVLAAVVGIGAFAAVTQLPKSTVVVEKPSNIISKPGLNAGRTPGAEIDPTLSGDPNAFPGMAPGGSGDASPFPVPAPSFNPDEPVVSPPNPGAPGGVILGPDGKPLKPSIMPPTGPGGRPFPGVPNGRPPRPGAADGASGAPPNVRPEPGLRPPPSIGGRLPSGSVPPLPPNINPLPPSGGGVAPLTPDDLSGNPTMPPVEPVAMGETLARQVRIEVTSFDGRVVGNTRNGDGSRRLAVQVPQGRAEGLVRRLREVMGSRGSVSDPKGVESSEDMIKDLQDDLRRERREREDLLKTFFEDAQPVKEKDEKIKVLEDLIAQRRKSMREKPASLTVIIRAA